MLNWFKRWQNNRSRAIFRYWDGSNEASADPLAVWRAFRADPEFDAERDIPALQLDDDKSLAVTIAAVRRAFGLKALEQGGLTEGECIALLYQFIAYVGHVKKNTSQTPTSPPATEPTSSEGSITKPESDCTSTSNAPNSAEPAAY